MRALFAVTILLGAALLFWVEPMISKMVLPLLGGTPAVWHTCVLFFQAMLLAGYAYAHVLSTRFRPRTQAIVHVALVVLAAISLPVGLATRDVPGTLGNPAGWLLGLLAASVGLPFLVLSTTSPLLQRWYGNVGKGDPYLLYVASNAGSLLSLLAYPVLLEPRLPLASQSVAWSVGYGLFALAIVACALGARDTGRAGRRDSVSASALDGRDGVAGSRETSVSRAEPLSWRRRGHWVLLAFVPSSLMLGVTGYITTDLAPIPLLWVVPLALYLLTFILAFGAKEGGALHVLTPLLVIFAGLQLFLMIVGWDKPVWGVILLHLLTFFVAARVCHGALAKDRPGVSRLTEFYLWISIGGALGGLFNSIVAPLVFDSIADYPIALVLACLVAPGVSGTFDRVRDLFAPLAVAGVTVALWLFVRTQDASWLWLKVVIVYVVPLLVAIAALRRPIRFALGAGPILLVTLVFSFQLDIILAERTFFGVHRVVYDDLDGVPYHGLMHGTTLHGLQLMQDDRKLEPLMYYHREGPVGAIMEALPEHPRKLGVVGLGTGGLSVFTRPGDALTYYEIDPEVLRIARDSGLFTFLKDSPGTIDVVLGDARLSMAKATAQYDLIIVDAFSSDAIPVHLLTREAFRDVYLPHLAPGGRIALHVSNRYLMLEHVLAEIAAADGLAHRIADDDERDDAKNKLPSTWVVLARDEADLTALGVRKGWQWSTLAPRPGHAVWTDDWSNVFDVFEWRPGEKAQ